MASINELLQEAKQVTGKDSKSAGVVKTASADRILAFADLLSSGGNLEHPEQARELVEEFQPTGDQAMIEKVAEAVLVIDSFTNLALEAIRTGMVKEASATGKTADEINVAMEKLAAKIKSQPTRSGIKFLLGLLGAGTLGGVAHAVGKNQGLKQAAERYEAQQNAYGTPAQ
jgi:hypothetical protein